MHTIDLSKYNIRTDLIIEQNLNYKATTKVIDENIEVESCTSNNERYTTIKFNDITDQNNFNNVLSVFSEELTKILPNFKNRSILVIGLGNATSTPDALGPLTVDKVLVTRHLFDIGEVEEGYEKVAIFKPQVTSQTGIETSNLITSITKEIKADILIIIDALAASSISRVNKTIQITTSGIHPGSGVGNNRKEISKKTLEIPVIAIGVPTIVDYSTLIVDFFKYLIQKISYNKDNYNNSKLKLVSEKQKNYLNHQNTLNSTEQEKLLGMIGTLSEAEKKELIDEVLIPLNYNLMVTPKEIDFIIEKLSILISKGINQTLHTNLNRQNN